MSLPKQSNPPQRFELYNPNQFKSKSSHAEFQPNVKSKSEQSQPYVLVENAPYTRIYHGLIVDNATNKPLYDLAAIAEPTGAIALPLSIDGRIALLTQWRPVPSSQPGSNSFSLPEQTCHGFYSLELPRGYPQPNESHQDAAVRETREELSIWAGHPKLLAWTNFNTALVMTDIPIYLVIVNPKVKVSDQRDDTEVIQNILWFTMEEVKALVRDQKIRCGLTLTALGLLFAAESDIKQYIQRVDISHI